MIQSLIFIVVAGACFGFAGKKIFRLYRIAKGMTGTPWGSPKRLDRIPERVGAAIANVLFQKAVARKPMVGAIHAAIFWGFIIITIGTMEQFLSTLIPGASFEFLGEGGYGGLVLIQDWLTLGVLLAVVAAAIRRFLVRPKHLMQSSDANIVLLFTGMLMVAILLMNAGFILGHQPWYGSKQPVSMAVASWLAGFGWDQSAYQTFGLVWKWVHMLIVLGFGMYIPSSKHLHVLAAGPNTFLKTLDREKGMAPIDFENEKITQYGAAKVTDLSWKDGLDFYSCTECGRCQEVCPAWNTEKPLSPMKLIHDMKVNAFGNAAAIMAGKADDVTPIVDAHVTEDVLWACTSCRACEVACPVFIEHTDKIYSARRNLVLMESKFPKEVQNVFKNMETNATPWAFSAATRGDWAQGLEVKTMAEANAAEVEVLLWVGCAGSYDERNKKVLRSFVNLLKRAGIKFAILGSEEACTGDAARRIGNEFLFQTLAKMNVETLNRYSVKKIVTACPHCFNTLKNEYKDFGGNYDVVHHSQMIAELLSKGRLQPKNANNEKVTFHDSCYLGRWNNEYASPRAAIQAIPGVQYSEISANHDKAMCCGAGGGRMWMEETIGKRVNVTRTEQALATGATTVAAACPFCMTMLSDGMKTKEVADKVKVRDIAELMDDATQ